MALRRIALRRSNLGTTELLNSQLPCGAWSNCPVTAIPNAYATGLALLALAHCKPSERSEEAASQGFKWLEQTRGRESHWLWQWKFRLFDRKVRFDPGKSGWPWVENTVSWVAPTALVLLAYAAWGKSSNRISSAIAMLQDRACPSGGWNAGNGHAFGVDLDPHPDFTAMAVCALRAHGQLDSRKAAQYLERRLQSCPSTYSLAWGVLALANLLEISATSVRESLRRMADAQASTMNTTALALTLLALETPVFRFGRRA
ncbi:terpene cyclase/mutase family protein [Bryobacter aggregatus]|uniref:terpene cyclase/mutase family protein n=1 Tax=Bryobacter aggregatus TaxID=360054 RepID=UPI0004E1F9D1|nr:terpene cyclase/mutase family protein [Bryobacter aggregatus]